MENKFKNIFMFNKKKPITCYFLRIKSSLYIYYVFKVNTPFYSNKEAIEMHVKCCKKHKNLARQEIVLLPRPCTR